MNLRKRKSTIIDQVHQNKKIRVREIDQVQHQKKKRVRETDQGEQKKKKQRVSKISQVQQKKKNQRVTKISQVQQKKKNQRVTKISQVQQKKKNQRVTKISQVQNSKKNHLSSPSLYLPEELIIDSILTRAAARDLAVCSCVSKLWYNSIYNDKRFAANHFVQNKTKLKLVFNLFNVGANDSNEAHFFGIEESSNWYDEYETHNFKGLCMIRLESSNQLLEPVGYCNGLACLTPVANDVFLVVNPARSETLALRYLYPSGGYIYLCHGFGFDTSSQEYKVVVIFTSAVSDEFVCMVTTLGTNLWRKITFATAEIINGGMATRVLNTRQATLCGGHLFWRTTNETVVVKEDIVNDNPFEFHEFEMLLSFDLHSEKIQFIRLPAETTMPAVDEYQCSDHLLEFKGYPCIARSEKIVTDHRRRRCNYTNSFCWCCYKVHLYILKDMVEQKWVKEETFDVQIKDENGLLPASFCSYSFKPPPTHILSFYDQVLLYWFDGKTLVIYNLQTKHLEVIKGSCSHPDIFATRMNEFHASGIGYTDYQLHAQVENMLNLENLHS